MELALVQSAFVALVVFALLAGAPPCAAQPPPSGFGGGAGDETAAFSLFGGFGGRGNPLGRGVTLGVGPLYFHDWQSSLATTFAESVVTLRDLVHGTSSTTRIPGDPDLDNRKFDYDFEIHGAGVRVPVGLPGFGRGRRFGLASELAFEVADADVAFTFHDRTQPELSTSLRGNGLLLGAGLDLETRFCAACPWSVSWSYWYRTLSGVEVDRNDPIDAPGQEVTRDRVTLDRDTHEVALRTGYATAIGKRRTYPYAGVLYQRTDVELDDELALSSPTLGLETDIRSRSRFASDVTRALAGVEIELGSSLTGRLEGSTSGGDHGGFAQIRWKVRGVPRVKLKSSRSLAEFIANGPLVVAFTSRRFAVEAPVAGGWPLVVEHELRESGTLRVEVATGEETLTFELSGTAGSARELVGMLPESLGPEPRMALVSVEAFTEGSDEPAEFRFVGLGLGHGAVASVAIDQVTFSPARIVASQFADWSFVCLKDFNRAGLEIYRQYFDEPEQGQAAADPPVRRAIKTEQVWHREPATCALAPQAKPCSGRWDGQRTDGTLSVGRHVLTVRAWRKGGDSATKVAPTAVSVTEEAVR